ncbi:hypothetical protein HYW72_00095 [Candidatus Nomurabacteria bacterium]|nr:hypothetical protein [Candidatus Nomurabacteria bacterium]
MNQNSILENSFLGSKWLNPDFWFSQGAAFFHQLFDFLNNNGTGITSIFHTFLFFISLFFLTIISYTSIRLFEIRSKEKKHLQREIDEYAHHQAEREKKKQAGEGGSKNERWTKTLSYLFSQHPGDWKLAVIEADTMLESLMDQLGFRGENLGDKLKEAAQPSRQLVGGQSFRGLSSAWEVHTIRNKIAHEGASFELSQHEAKRVIALYEQIFREFGYI